MKLLNLKIRLDRTDAQRDDYSCIVTPMSLSDNGQNVPATGFPTLESRP